MKNEKTPDEDIIKRVLYGDTDSFKIIVKRYQKHLFAIGMRFFRNEDDSYDFAQEVFIKAFKKLKTFKGHSPFRFWLIKIAYNHGINRKKTIKEEMVIAEESLSVSNDIPERLHVHGEIKEILIDAINALNEQYRVCLDLYFFVGLSYTEISDITEYPVNTIKSNVFRAKKILRDTLKGTIAEDYHEM